MERLPISVLSFHTGNMVTVLSSPGDNGAEN